MRHAPDIPHAGRPRSAARLRRAGCEGSRSPRPVAWALLVVLLAGVAPAPGERPPEDRRLDANRFRDGLKTRGLLELLELHLEDSPHHSEAERLLLRRDLLLAEYAAPETPPDRRLAVLAEANDLLRQLIDEYPRSPDALQWRLDLAVSLLYQQAEPYRANILYRGGTAEDRRQLGAIVPEVVEVLDVLLALVEVELARLDALSLPEYERLEEEGYIEQLERLQPQAEYIRRWAVFCRALARSQDDPERVGEFQSVATELREKTSLLEVPHEESHLQIQSLLLSAMAQRRVGDQVSALACLDEALQAAGRLADAAERQSLQWAVLLARLERIRALADARRYPEALAAVSEFRRLIDPDTERAFGLQLVVTLAEASVVHSQARRAAAAGNQQLARRLERRAVEPLMRLAGRSEGYRDAIYALLYDTLDAQRDPASLHPFERCALIAGLLSEADRLARSAGRPAGPSATPERGAEHARLLDRAIAVGQSVLAEADALEGSLPGEVLYNLGVAHYRRGQPLESASSFLAAARDYPHFGRAPAAAALAVQTAAELYQQPGMSGREDVRTVYAEALALLTERYPDSEAGRYWRYFNAQLLEESGDYRRAARQYATVAPDHEHYARACFFRVRCLAALAREHAAGGDADRATAVIDAAQDFLRRAKAGHFGSDTPQRLAPLVARAEVILAEMLVLPGVNRPEDALAMLAEYRDRHADALELIGRVLRVRIIAYEALGRLLDAEREIQRYIESDPRHAGTTLQGLFDVLSEEIARLERAGAAEQAGQKRAEALVLARKIHEWSASPAAGVSEQEQDLLCLQVAESSLQAGRPREAVRLFQAVRSRAAQRGGPLAEDARVVFGLAEALSRLGRYAEALSCYNQVYRGTPADTPLWWGALLGDLRCRTELGHDPAGIVKAIKQHRYLYRNEMGGPRLQAGFEELLKRNENRRAASPPLHEGDPVRGSRAP